MPPVVIDLTSSPEPDGSPSKSLQTWRPRKKKELDKNSGRIERQRDNDVSPSSRPGSRAAQSALSNSKQVTKEASSHVKQLNGIVSALGSAWGSLSIAPPGYLLEQEQKKPQEYVSPYLSTPREGSLASLLQASAQQTIRKPPNEEAATENGTRYTERPLKLPPRFSPAGKESERVSALSKFQNNRRDATAIPTAAQEPSEIPVISKVPSKDLVKNNYYESAIHRSKSFNVNEQVEFDTIRPFKRRRVGEIDTQRFSQNDRLANEGSKSVKFTGLHGHPAPRNPHSGMPIRSASPASSAATQPKFTPIGMSDVLKQSRTLSSAFRRDAQNIEPWSPPVAKTAEKATDPAQSSSQEQSPSTGNLSERPGGSTDTENTLEEDIIRVNPLKTDLEKSREASAVRVTSDNEPQQRTTQQTAAAAPPINKTPAGNRPYTAEEDALIVKLKEVDQLGWQEITKRFAGSRTYGSLQVRYSTTLKRRDVLSKDALSKRTALRSRMESGHGASCSESTESDAASRPIRKKRNNDAPATEGFISWAQVKKRRMFDESQATAEDVESERENNSIEERFQGERMHPLSLQRILRQRECASSTARNSILPKLIPDELKESVLDNIGPLRYYKGTSGDVTCLAWAPNGQAFAAGSIAITDERSMQYNRPNNLLFGRRELSLLQELPEHHVQRPAIANSGNVNSLHSMRETQDSRLFMTVASVNFSPDSSTMYSAGSDRKVRAYAVNENSISHSYALDHASHVDLLSVSNFDLLASACHQSTDKSIAIFKGQHRVLELSPDRKDEQTKRAIYPSALRWGSAYRHSHFLLAGFAIDSADEERYIAGETCLWDIQHESRIPIHGIARNVFDVAWNPSPSAGSSIFAVASSRGIGSTSRGTHSVVQCFGANTRRTIGWECPAFDINDVIFCKHDDNLIAAGATDGKIYVWDQRFADRSCRPLHTLEHGNTLNILDHEQDREVADTGVRFLSWSSTRSRLYTGSSDGVLKIWNPYRSTEDAHIKDVASFNSAIMSGAFSPDDRDLLIGEDQGQVNLLSVANEHRALRSARRFDILSGPVLAGEREQDRLAAARALKASGEISFRLMGNLPKRQAVQDSNYRGPYLKPSPDEMRQANEEYQLALNAQNEAESSILQDRNIGEENSDALRLATRQVQDAQARVLSLQNRLDDSFVLEKTARANQQQFLQAAQARLNETSKPVDQCDLGCNYLPSHVDDDGDVPDSRRSEMRIPEVLRSLASLDISDLAEEDTSKLAKCVSCLDVAPMPSKGKQALCERCSRTRNGLNGSCKLCSSPIRPHTNSGDLCEKCGFACFRCGNNSMIARDVSFVNCEHCSLTWRAGVLGYELVENAGPSDSVQKQPVDWRQCDTGTFDDPEGPCNEEIEHYASIWGT